MFLFYIYIYIHLFNKKTIYMETIVYTQFVILCDPVFYTCLQVTVVNRQRGVVVLVVVKLGLHFSLQSDLAVLRSVLVLSVRFSSNCVHI